MGLFSFGKKILGAVGAVSKVPILGNAIKAVPVVGTVASVGGLAADVFSSGRKGGPVMPALPGMPGLPGVSAAAPVGMGERSIFRDDPNVVEALKPYAIAERFLRPYYRAPRGAVIVYDQAGKPYGLPKKVARMAGLWKPAKKPPISVGDYQAILRADRTVKKMKKIFARTARVEKNVHKGRVKVKGGHK